jgi:hypothetical protein
MLEGRCEVTQICLPQPHFRTECDLPPVRHRHMHFGQHRQGLGFVQPEVGGTRQQHLHIGDRPILLGQPGPGLTVLVRERIDVEGRRQAPLAVCHVQEAVVLPVIVHVGNQQVEHQPAPEVLHVLRGSMAVVRMASTISV